MLFDETTLRKLTRLTLTARRVRAGVLKGERRSTKRGAGTEFADFRQYTPGDDLRRVDWKIYARLDRPFLKLFEEEEDLAVHLLVDVSRSMDWSEAEENKFHYARRLAAGLGAIALANGDSLTVQPLNTGRGSAPFGPARGAASTARLLLYLESLPAGGGTDLGPGLKRYALSTHRPGLAFLLSDLLTAEDPLNGLNALQSHGFETTVIHLLSPEELDPPLSGDLRLLDVETGQAQEVSLDGGLRTIYRQRLKAWQDEIAVACQNRGIRYLPLSTKTPWERFILQELRKAGVVK
jgi:uncharacterized protein (DUF58 family)